jgi:hypothetical protein
MKTKDFSMLGETVLTSSGTKDLAYVDGMNSIVAQIENVLKTNKGENAGDVNFGSDIFSYFYDMSIDNRYICTTIQSAIKYSIKKIFKVKVILLGRSELFLKLKIDFYIESEPGKSNAAACIIEIASTL